MKRKLGAVLFVLYAIIAITVTVLLLSFNDYNCSEIGGYTVYIVKDDSLEPTYKRGSILLIQSSSDKNIKVGDELFLYKVINSQEFEIVTETLEGKVQQGRHIIYEVPGEASYSSEYCIGKTSNTTVIEGPWGTILSILESKWGYLFCIVIVSLLLFLQEVFDLIMELKYGTHKQSKNAKTAKTTKTTQNAKTTKSASTTKTTQATKVVKVAQAVKATKAANDVANNENNQVDVKEG